MFASPPSVTTVRNAVFAAVVLTLFHFSDNALNLESYPGASWQPAWFEFVIGAGWPLFTAIGLRAWWLYRAGRVRMAGSWLLAYSSVGFVTLAHFAYGGPGDFTTRALISIAIDAVAGAVILVLAVRTIRAGS